MRLLIVALLLLCSLPAFPQETETIRLDSTAQIDSLVSIQDVNRGPKRALLWAIIPGGGQVYNKAWWKVPLVYGGLLGVIAVADFNTTQYNRFQDALEARCLGDGNIVEPPFAECMIRESEFPVESISTDALRRARDNANRSRQTAYIGILIAYLMQGIEAYTDAHLKDFDISDDLSIRLAPIVHPGATAGAGLVVPLGAGKRVKLQEARLRSLTR